MSTGPAGPTGITGPQGVQGSQGSFGPTGRQGIQGTQGAPMFIAQNPDIWQGSPPTTMEEAVNRLSMIIYGRTAESGLLSMASSAANVITNNNAQGNSDALITKYTTAGGVQWAARIGGTGNDEGRAISADAVGNVYITGHYFSNQVTIFNANGATFGTLVNSGNNNVFVIKYNTNGVCQWATRIGEIQVGGASGISVDANGNVYVTGRYTSNPVTIFNVDGTAFGTLANSGDFDIYIVKYNTNGVCQWATRIGTSGRELVNGISVDAAGNVYCIGSYESNPLTIFNAGGATFGTLVNSGNNDVFVIKYNTNGVCQWAARIGGTGDDQGMAISADAVGNVYCTGFYGSNSLTVFNANGTTFGTLSRLSFRDTFIVKYNTNGVCQWATRIAGETQGRAVSVDGTGNVYVTGLYNSNPMTMFNANGTSFGTLANSGGNDVFVVKYNTNGLCQWAAGIGGTGNEFASGISTDSGGNIVVTFENQSTPCTIFNATGSAFGTIVGNGLVKYNTDGQGVWAASTPVSLHGVSADPGTNVYTIGTAFGAINPLILRGAGL